MKRKTSPKKKFYILFIAIAAIAVILILNIENGGFSSAVTESGSTEAAGVNGETGNTAAADANSGTADTDVLTVNSENGNTDVPEADSEAANTDVSAQKEETASTADDTNKVSNVLVTGNLNVEILSCTFVKGEDLDESVYAPEYFYTGVMPDKDSASTRIYYFLKCHIRNRAATSVYECLDLDNYIEYKNEKYLGLAEGLCYFDKAENTEGEDRLHEFFWRTYAPEEEITCVLGFVIDTSDHRDGEGLEVKDYYVGTQPPGLDYFTLDNLKGKILSLNAMRTDQ